MRLQRRINKRHREGMSVDQLYEKRLARKIGSVGDDSVIPRRFAGFETPDVIVDEFAQAGTSGGDDNRGRFGEWIGPNHPDKGKKDGRCNRTACQRPLKDEPTHQFMRDWMTTNGRLFYCAKCAHDFDDWDYRSGDPIRISREPKTCEVA